MSVGLILLRFTIPCAPGENLRGRILRTLKAGVKFIEDAPSEGAALEAVQRRGGTPETGLPLEGELNDEQGLCGMYPTQSLNFLDQRRHGERRLQHEPHRSAVKGFRVEINRAKVIKQVRDQ